jgi:hypothetical protein
VGTTSLLLSTTFQLLYAMDALYYEENFFQSYEAVNIG